MSHHYEEDTHQASRKKPAPKPAATDTIGPCPFCKAGDVTIYYDSCGNRITCRSCDWMGPARQTNAEAITAWNRAADAIRKRDEVIEALADVASNWGHYKCVQSALRRAAELKDAK